VCIDWSRKFIPLFFEFQWNIDRASPPPRRMDAPDRHQRTFVRLFHMLSFTHMTRAFNLTHIYEQFVDKTIVYTSLSTEQLETTFCYHFSSTLQQLLQTWQTLTSYSKLTQHNQSQRQAVQQLWLRVASARRLARARLVLVEAGGTSARLCMHCTCASPESIGPPKLFFIGPTRQP